MIIGGEEVRVFVYETLGVDVLGVEFNPAKSYDENYEAASETAWNNCAQALTDALVAHEAKFMGPYSYLEHGGVPIFLDQNGEFVPPPEPCKQRRQRKQRGSLRWLCCLLFIQARAMVFATSGRIIKSTHSNAHEITSSFNREPQATACWSVQANAVACGSRLNDLKANREVIS